MTKSRHRNVYPDGAACFWTSSVVASVPILKSPAVAKILLRLWDHYRRAYNVKLLGYVIMPDHIHLVLWAERGVNIQRFLKRTLSLSATEIGKLVERTAARGDVLAGAWLTVFQSHAGSGSRLGVWKERGHAFPVEKGEVMRQKMKYLHENPVRKHFVEHPEDWMFSSAAWYADGTGPIAIDSVDSW